MARFWCLHQLAPFLDQTFGVAGAMDHRMIDRSCQNGPGQCLREYFDYDWFVRLPLMVVCMAYPERRLLLAAHALNVFGLLDRMPAVWDYMCWCGIMELTFVVAAALSAADWRGLAHTPAHHRSRLSDSVKNGDALRTMPLSPHAREEEARREEERRDGRGLMGCVQSWVVVCV